LLRELIAKEREQTKRTYISVCRVVIRVDAYGVRSVKTLFENSSPGSEAAATVITMAIIHAFIVGAIVEFDNKYNRVRVAAKADNRATARIYANGPVS
jgi:hypothetical protein